MITACFARAPQRGTSRIYMHFLLLFQEVRSISKTRNQLRVYRIRFCRKVRFWGKIQKSDLRNSRTYRLSNARKSNFATEPFHDLLSKLCDRTLCCPGAPRPMKIEFTRQPRNYVGHTVG